MKKFLKVISSLFAAILMFFNVTSIVFASQPSQEDQQKIIVKDEEGEPLKTGKKYIIASEDFINRGLTFEVYNNWDYVLASNTRQDNKLYGTEIQLFIENTNEAQGIDITTNDKVIIKMLNHNWAGYKYLSFNRKSGYVWLDKKGTSITLEQDNENKVAMNAGAFVTKYYDSFGRPTGKLQGKTRVSDYTYLYVFPIGQLFGDPQKLWLGVHMRMHSTYTGKDIPGKKPEFLFRAVN